MVALIQPQTLRPNTRPAAVRPANRRSSAPRTAPTAGTGAQRHLQVVPQAQASPVAEFRQWALGLDRAVVGVAAVCLTIAAAFIGLGMVQSGGPSSPLQALSGPAAVAAAGEGEATLLVTKGDTMWDIASSVAGVGQDPRPIMTMLAERNGGSAIWAGQELVVPAELVSTLFALGAEEHAG